LTEFFSITIQSQSSIIMETESFVYENQHHPEQITHSRTQEYYTFLQTFLLQYHYQVFNRVLCKMAVETSESMSSLYKKELQCPNQIMWNTIFDSSTSQDLLLYFYLFNRVHTTSISTTTSQEKDADTDTPKTELHFTYPSFVFPIYNTTPSTTPSNTSSSPLLHVYPSLSYQEFVNYVLEESFKKSSITEHMHLVNRIKSGKMEIELTEKHREHSFLCDLKNNIVTGIHNMLQSRIYPYVAQYEIPDMNLLAFMNYGIHHSFLDPYFKINAITDGEVFNILEKKAFHEIQSYM